MKFERFIASHFHFDKTKTRTVSRPAIRVATIGIAVGLAVMIMSVSIIFGFKREIKTKITGFASHLQLTHYDRNTTYETTPICFNDSLKNAWQQIPHIRQIQTFATKSGIIKTNDEFMGVAVKGIGKDYDTRFLKKYLQCGAIPYFSDSTASNQVLISQFIAHKMRLTIGDSFTTYFVGQQIRARKFKVAGIYRTDIAEYDKLFIIADIRHLQKLNGWQPYQVSGIEFFADNDNRIDQVHYDLSEQTSNKFNDDGSAFLLQTIRQQYPAIFEWLDFLDINVWIILILMLTVAGFNMVSGLLILILERTYHIGVLKALGTSNWKIRKIFLCQSTFLVGRGMFWGNLFGVGLCLIQYFTHLIPLEAEAYYVSYVPIALDPFYWLILNIGTAVISILMMIIPTTIITRISPAQSMLFE